MTFFPQILNMSLSASVVILFVTAARLLLKRAPKVLSYALWSVVLFRLLCPVTIESPVSAMPELPQVTVQTVDTMLPELEFTTPADREQNQLSTDTEVGHSASPTVWLTILWAAGMAGMAVWALVSYIRLRKKLVGAMCLRDNIYLADRIASPFVLGLFRPGIYLPSGMENTAHILLHEQYHIRRLDHVVKALAFLALCIHWFNPLVWLAFVLAGRDMEMSCDEAVMKRLGPDVQADYAASLLELATGKPVFAGTPLAFGEGNTKDRIKNLANWKKPVFWIVVVAATLCAVLAVCLITDPASGSSLTRPVSVDEETLQNKINAAILAHNETGRSASRICVESHEILASESSGDGSVVTVYMLVLYEEFSPYNNNDSESGSYVPTALTLDLANNALLEYWEPRDGAYYADDIRNKFPGSAARAARNEQKYIDRLQAENLAKVTARRKGLGDFEETLTGIIEKICTEPAHSSNPGDYIAAHPELYNKLVNYSTYTMEYCFRRFLQGGEHGLEGHIMAQACRDILESWHQTPELGTQMTGQDWFDAFYARSLELRETVSEEEFAKHYPGSWLLTEMVEK